MPTKEDIELYEEAEGVSKTKKPKPSEKITLLDGIKWLEKYCKSLIPILVVFVLSLVSFQMLKNYSETENVFSMDIKNENYGSLRVRGVDFNFDFPSSIDVNPMGSLTTCEICQ